jgi:hypothetical protein
LSRPHKKRKKIELLPSERKDLQFRGTNGKPFRTEFLEEASQLFSVKAFHLDGNARSGGGELGDPIPKGKAIEHPGKCAQGIHGRDLFFFLLTRKGLVLGKGAHELKKTPLLHRRTSIHAPGVGTPQKSGAPHEKTEKGEQQGGAGIFSPLAEPGQDISEAHPLHDADHLTVMVKRRPPPGAWEMSPRCISILDEAFFAPKRAH